MNEDIATLLGVGNPKLADLCPIMPRHMKQSVVADLSTHLGIARRAIEDDVDLFRIFSRQNGFNDRLRFEKIVSEKFRRRSFERACFHADFFLLLRPSRALALFLHQGLKTSNIDGEPTFARH